MGRTLLIILVFALAGGYYLYSWQATQQARVEISDAVRDARRTFADKAASIVVEDETDDYLDRIKEALSAYEKELDDIYEEHPKWRNPDAYEEDVNERFEKGELKEAQVKSMLEGFELVKSAYDTLLAGSWKPVLSSKVDAGNLRMDLFDFERTEDVDGNPLLQAKALFWGIESNSRVSWGGLTLRYWTRGDPPKEVKKELRKQGLPTEDVEYVLGRADGPSQPYIFLQSPSKYIETFPPYVALGLVQWPVMPTEATLVDVTYSYSVKKGGGMYEAMHTWEKLPIPPRWQLREGEVWNADVIEATAEEIAGREDEEEEEEKK